MNEEELEKYVEHNRWLTEQNNLMKAAIESRDHTRMRELRQSVGRNWSDTYPCLIYFAERSEDLETMTLLLELGDNVNGVNEYGETALCDAVRYGRLKSIDFLLEHGADPAVFGQDSMNASFSVPGTPLLGRVAATALYWQVQEPGWMPPLYAGLALLFDRRPELISIWLSGENIVEHTRQYMLEKIRNSSINQRIAVALYERHRDDLAKMFSI